MPVSNERPPTSYMGEPATNKRMGLVRLATAAEATAGTSNLIAVTPAQLAAAVAATGPVSATTLTSSGLTSLATGAGVALNLGNTTGTIGFFGVTAAAKPGLTTDLKDGLALMGLITNGGATPLNLDGGAFTAGTVAAVSTITAGTTLTATLGNITATNGNIVASTAGTGLQFNANTATGAAASPIVLNSRAGAAVFTSVSIAAAADLTLTITNSAITGASTQVIYSMSGATTGSALSIKSVTNSAGSSAIVVTNGTGATTTTADITLTFIVVN